MFEFHPSKVATVKNDVLSGLTVALALVPEAVAFAFVAGVEPLVGLYAAFMVGLITACIGGRPGMISGATGALAVVMVALVADHGVEYLFAAVVLMGILQITAGAMRLGKFIRMVPHPVMLGFVNGLAIVIFLAQLGQFGIAGEPGWLEGTFMQGSILDVAWLEDAQLYMLLGLVVLTMVIIHFLPRLTTTLPSSLVAILVVSIIFPYSVILAAIGLIESLLTLRLVDEITESRGRGNKECIGQGVANTVTGFFGGMGGCAMIGQSMINVNSGGRGRST
jgi:SulP family sulfate permease